MKYSRLVCPNCGANLRITKELKIGTIASCKFCSNEFTIERGPEDANHPVQLQDKKLTYGLNEFLDHIKNAESREEKIAQAKIDSYKKDTLLVRAIFLGIGGVVGIILG